VLPFYRSEFSLRCKSKSSDVGFAHSSKVIMHFTKMKIYIFFLVLFGIVGKLSGQTYFEKKYPISRDSQLGYFYSLRLDASQIFIDYDVTTFYNPDKYIGILDTNLKLENKFYTKANFTDNNMAFGQTAGSIYIGTVKKNEGGGSLYDSSEVIIYNKYLHTVNRDQVRDIPQRQDPQTITLRIYDNRVYTISQAQMNNYPGYHDSMWRMTISDTNLNPLKIVELKLDKQLVGNDFVKIGDKFYLIGSYIDFYTHDREDFRCYVELFKFNADWEIIGHNRFFYQQPPERKMNRIIRTHDDGLVISTALTSDSLGPSNESLENSFFKLDTNLNVVWSYRIKCGTCLAFSKIVETEHGDFFACGVRDYKGYILKLDRNGNKIWEHTYLPSFEEGSVSFSTIEGVYELAGGNLVTFGKCVQEFDTFTQHHIWLMKLDRNGCPGYACGDEVFLESKHIPIDQTKPSMRVYPNPGSDRIEIALPEVQKYGFPTAYSLLDAHGKSLLTVPGDRSETQYLDTRQLPPGVYFITATYRDHTQQSIKWIKERK
ncbi:MAG TPA: T9SS type A sorting domain-containing protein, partial [Saprospiraceae bacterium]|nr:T9SS type A sorting domain-containing protein [Saprospiraceae bacterium]